MTKRHPSPINGDILVLSSSICNIISSAAEAEFGTLFDNGKEADSVHTIPANLSHHQSPTLIQIDNKYAAGIVNETVR